MMATSGIQAAQNVSDEIQLSTTSVSYSEASAIYQIYNESWKDQPQIHGRKAFSRNRLSLGIRKHGISLAYIERHDWLSDFSPDTARLLYLEGSDQPIPAGDEYDFNLRIKQLSARGLRIGFHLPEWKNINLITYFSMLHGRRFQEGHLQGDVLQPSPSNYRGKASINYYYSQDLLLEHQLDSPTGHGNALDIELHWQHGPLQASLIAEDLWMKMTWDDAGRTIGQLDTDTVAYNANGFVRYNALFSGMRGIDEYHQNMPAMTYGEFIWNHDQLRFINGVWYYYNKMFPFIGLGHHISKTSYMSTSYEFNSGKVTLEYRYQQQNSDLSLRLGSDNTDFSYAKALELNISTGYRF